MCPILLTFYDRNEHGLMVCTLILQFQLTAMAMILNYDPWAVIYDHKVHTMPSKVSSG